jgi:hypothetical protein
LVASETFEDDRIWTNRAWPLLLHATAGAAGYWAGDVAGERERRAFDPRGLEAG